MILAYLTLLTALAISGVAAYYSIIGLVAIFSASVIPIAVMGVVLETGKLVSAAWLYHYWKKTNVLLKTYLISAVVVLMFITSMGIFGFLSKAHIEQTTITSDNTLKIELIQSQIQRERRTIERAESTLARLDSALDKYIELGAITKGLGKREEQEEERNLLNTTVNNAQLRIDDLLDEKTEFNLQIKNFEAEVGPLKYISALFYGEDALDYIDRSVRYVILILVFVFDPLAVLLIIAANMSFHEYNTKVKRRKNRKKNKGDITTTVQQQGELRKVTKEQNGVEINYYE